MRLQSAIFDMDGTLLDSMPAWRSLASRALRRLGREPEPGLDRRLRAMTVAQASAYCRERYGLDCSAEELAALFLGEMERFYRTEVLAKPGVERFLSLLRMEGVWMYVATATDRPLAEAALERTGLRRYFRGIVTTQETGLGKDHPEIYERALRRLRSRKEDTAVFEDALYAARTAKAAGFRVAAVYDPSMEADQEALRSLADWYIRSFEEMAEAERLDQRGAGEHEELGG